MLALAGSVVYTQVVQPSGAHEVRWHDLGDALGSAHFARQVTAAFRTHEAFARFLTDATLPPSPRVPPIDFRRRTALLAASGPRSSTGYDLGVVRVVERRSRIDVLLRERAPELGERAVPRLTFPYLLITIPATDKPIRFRLEGRP